MCNIILEAFTSSFGILFFFFFNFFIAKIVECYRNQEKNFSTPSLCFHFILFIYFGNFTLTLSCEIQYSQFSPFHIMFLAFTSDGRRGMEILGKAWVLK